MTALGDLAWPAVTGALLVWPVGSTEQHGPHLPLSTDTDVAEALARGLADRRPGAVVAPALAYGSAGEHAGFPGTLSMGADALQAVVREVVRSADAFAGVVVVSGHGGNAAPLHAAATQLNREGRRVLVWSPRLPGADAHAGRAETSLLLALRPEAVDMSAAEPGDRRPLTELMPALRRDGVAAVSPNGVLGDPTGASAQEGHRLLAELVDDLADAVTAWWEAASDT